MPHVFDYEKNKFNQVHAKKVDQRPMTAIYKRQKNSEYLKFLLGLEKEQIAKYEAKQAKKGD